MSNEHKNLLQVFLESIQGPFSAFIRAQRTSGIFLLAATLTALWWANSQYAASYQSLIDTPIGAFVGGLELRAPLKHIINDGLMAVFFFLLGLEIKREVLAGEFAHQDNRRMLLLCVFGGMLMPALRSGIHPNVAGVAIAVTIPARPRIASRQLLNKERSIIAAMRVKTAAFDVLVSRRDHQYVKDVHDLAERAGTPLRRWEDAITLPVSLFILKLFALANAGIGFTMSTFIAALGFDAQPDVLQHAKTAILMASVISATLGMAYIRVVSVAGSSGKGD